MEGGGWEVNTFQPALEVSWSVCVGINTSHSRMEMLKVWVVGLGGGGVNAS